MMKILLVLIILFSISLTHAEENESLSFLCKPFSESSTQTATVNEPYCITSRTPLSIKGLSEEDFKVDFSSSYSGRYIYIYVFEKTAAVKVISENASMRLRVIDPFERDVKAKLMADIASMEDMLEENNKTITRLTEENIKLKSKLDNITNYSIYLKNSKVVYEPVYLDGNETIMWILKSQKERQNRDVLTYTLLIVTSLILLTLSVRWWLRWKSE